SGSQAFGLVADVVEDAPAVFETTHLGPNLFGTTVKEEASEHFRRRGGRWNQCAGARPGQASAFARQGQARKTGAAADLFGRKLVQRDGVAKAGSARARHSRQEADGRLMGEPWAHSRVRQSGDDREVTAEVLEDLQMWC